VISDFSPVWWRPRRVLPSLGGASEIARAERKDLRLPCPIAGASPHTGVSIGLSFLYMKKPSSWVFAIDLFVR
jgi:hypothetical protein